MRLELEVTMADGTEITTTAIVADFIKWEEKTGRVIGDLANGAGISDMSFLAWASLKRENPKLPDFNTWVVNVLSLTSSDGEDPKVTGKGR